MAAEVVTARMLPGGARRGRPSLPVCAGRRREYRPIVSIALTQAGRARGYGQVRQSARNAR